MTTSSITWTEEVLQVAGAEMNMKKGGSGEPLLVLHGEMGQPGWLRYHDELARNHTVYAPSHPGFGITGRVDWIMNMRDMAGWYLRALEELQLVGVDVLGFSMGGWLTAEMAAQSPRNFKKLVLVGAPGIKPPAGEILDMFLIVAREFITAGILDPATTEEFQTVCPDEPSPDLVEVWETAREEACRLSWRPYMYDQSLAFRLARLKDLPTLIVWGGQDGVVPLSVADSYNQAISGSRVATIDGCGHRPELEKTSQFVTLVRDFLG